MTPTMMRLEEVLKLPVHPTATIFPLLPESVRPGEDSLTMGEFAEQIRQAGKVTEPLVIWIRDGVPTLIDGRNRRKAARRLNRRDPNTITHVPVRYMEFDSDAEASDWIIGNAIDRRSMNKDQLACSAVLAWDIVAAKSKERQKATQFGAEKTTPPSDEAGKTRDILAARFHVPANHIQRARSLYINDRPKFELAASGKQRVLSGLKSPGQNLKSKITPKEKAQKALTNASLAFRKAAQDLTKVENSPETEDYIMKAVNELIENVTKDNDSRPAPPVLGCSACHDAYREAQQSKAKESAARWAVVDSEDWDGR